MAFELVAAAEVKLGILGGAVQNGLVAPVFPSEFGEGLHKLSPYLFLLVTRFYVNVFNAAGLYMLAIIILTL